MTCGSCTSRSSACVEGDGAWHGAVDVDIQFVRSEERTKRPPIRRAGQVSRALLSCGVGASRAECSLIR
jgi:hypothetical protein